VDPATWPCPSVSLTDAAATKAVKACGERFWSDKPRGEKKKRVAGEPRRWFHDTQDTFECRFYHGFGLRSPCEDKLKLWVVQLKVRGAKGELKELKDARCLVKVGAEADAALIRTDTGGDGRLHLPVVDDKTTMTLQVDAFGAQKPLPPGSKPPPGSTAPTPPAGGDPEAEVGEDQFFQIAIDAGSLIELDDTKTGPDDELAVKQRLHDLGFGPPVLASWTAADLGDAAGAFRDYRNGLGKLPALPPGKTWNDPLFRASLREEFGDTEPPFVPPENG